jgi:hypothetical protein
VRDCKLKNTTSQPLSLPSSLDAADQLRISVGIIIKRTSHFERSSLPMLYAAV